MLLSSNLRKSIRRLKFHRNNHTTELIKNGIKNSVNMTVSISSNNLKFLEVAHEEHPRSSRIFPKPRSTSSSPTSARRIVPFKQRHTWPLTKDAFRMPMLELIDGEKKYIDLLKMLITYYLGEYRKSEAAGKLPQNLRNKERAIFGNIEDVHAFHEK